MNDFHRRAVEEYVAGQWDVALLWTRVARMFGGGNLEFLALEAECLARLGFLVEALAAYAAADEIDPEGYSAFSAAEMVALLGGRPHEVMRWLHRALKKSPDLAGDLTLGKLAQLRDFPEFQEMVRSAYQSLGLDAPESPEPVGGAAA